jgi:mannose-6-phosphate isomerase-like protein (cupin superfamily)
MNKHVKITPEEALMKLSLQNKKDFEEMFDRGNLSLEYYKPRKFDKQLTHTRDEMYVIISGEGLFYYNGLHFPFKANDVIFVPAGVMHWFEDFEDDFATWVIFFGPDGGHK